MICIFPLQILQTVHWKTTPPHLLHSISVEWHIASNLATLVSSAKNHWGGLDPIFSDFGHSYLYLIYIIWYIIEKWPWGSDALCQALSTIYTVDPFTLLFLPLVGPWLWGSYRLELSLMLMSEAPCQHWKTTWSIQVLDLWSLYERHQATWPGKSANFQSFSSSNQNVNHETLVTVPNLTKAEGTVCCTKVLNLVKFWPWPYTWLSDWWMNGRW